MFVKIDLDRHLDDSQQQEGDRMQQADTQQQFHAGLPGWFVRFQDTVGLSLLVLALMGINGVVYASGVVKNIEDPGTWGAFGTGLLVLFFMAGMVMPGIALRAGSGIFWGPWLRRLVCALIAVMFFVLEVWTSITERSFMTYTSPADRWALSVFHTPDLPFSPTVLALSLAISTAVVAWGIVASPPVVESEEAVAHKEHLKTLRAQGRAERARIYGGAVGGAARAGVEAAKAQTMSPDDLVETGAQEDVETGAQEPDHAAADGRPMRTPRPARHAAPRGKMSAPQFRKMLADNGVTISEDYARAQVLGAKGFEKVGTTYYADSRALLSIANRLMEQARNGASERGERAG